MTNTQSNTSPQGAKSVDFNGVGFILIESTVFEIFVFYTRSSYVFVYYRISIDAKYYIVYIMHFESYEYDYLHE